jgi:uncharacterized lipoprotein YajG
MKPFLPFVFILLLAGCKKDDQAPQITITSPTDNQVFTNGQVISLAGSVSDDDQIHMVHIYVTNHNSGASVLHVAEHLDAKNYTISQTFTAQSGTSYDIEVEAEDHSGNSADKKLSVSAN